jgi:hypothetical protein
LPATFGKSTILARWLTIWRICQNPNTRGIVIMKNDAEVKDYATAIRNELAGNYELIKDFGPFKPPGRDAKWSNEAINVLHRQIIEVQPTVEFASSNTIDQVLGHRCDWFLADDIVTPTTTSTQAQRDKQESMFDEGIDTGPQYLWDRNPHWDPTKPGGPNNPFFLSKPEHIYWPEELRPYGKPLLYESGCIAGTAFHVDDLYHRKGRSPLGLTPGKLYKGNKAPWKLLYYDCWVHDEDNNVTDIPLMPSRWTKEKLLEKEKAGLIAFSRRYRNICIDEGHTVFRKLWLVGNEEEGGEYKGVLEDGGQGRPLRSWGQLPYEDGKWWLSLGVDPATGGVGEGYSWTAYVLLAVDLSAEVKERYLLDIYREQMGYEDIISRILVGDPRTGVGHGFYADYKFDIVCIERVAQNRWLLDSHRFQAAQVDNGFRVKGIETQANSKIAMVAELQDLFINGQIHIPYATPADREKAAELVEELTLYPQGAKDDFPMALAFANKGINDSKSPYRSWITGHGRYIETPHYKRV